MEPTQNTRARLLIAGSALVALVVLVVVVVLGGGDSEHEFAKAPDECVERWNADPNALATGRHNAGAHGYFRVQVAYGGEDGKTISPEPVEGGGCIVIFAASQLDPEPAAAAEIELDAGWTALSGSADTARLAELQGEALGEYNAQLGKDGVLTSIGER